MAQPDIETETEEETEIDDVDEEETTISYELLSNVETWYVVTVCGHRFHQPHLAEDLEHLAKAGEPHDPDQEAREVPEHPLDSDQQYEALLNIAARIGFSADSNSMKYATHLLHCLNRRAKELRDEEEYEARDEIYEAKDKFLDAALRAGLATVEQYEYLRSQYYHYTCDCGKEWNSSDEADPNDAVCFACSRSHYCDDEEDFDEYDNRDFDEDEWD